MPAVGNWQNDGINHDKWFKWLMHVHENMSKKKCTHLHKPPMTYDKLGKQMETRHLRVWPCTEISKPRTLALALPCGHQIFNDVPTGNFCIELSHCMHFVLPGMSTMYKVILTQEHVFHMSSCSLAQETLVRCKSMQYPMDSAGIFI